MPSPDEEIQKWETVEVERSASEASRRSSEDLSLAPSIIDRYFRPPSKHRTRLNMRTISWEM